ncbi:MAG: putative tricarboxylic transport rane protein [bacterium]|nr:putative tricarboxylic transport rane protein [bacterium]
MRKLGLVGLLVTLVVLGLVCAPFSYAKYPEKPITVFVGFPAGGPTDVIARGILPIVQEKLGVGIGIQNVPGVV